MRAHLQITANEVDRLLTDLPADHSPLRFDSVYATGLWRQFVVVYRRTNRHYLRLPSYR
jgi:hypothetical protein